MNIRNKKHFANMQGAFLMQFFRKEGVNVIRFIKLFIYEWRSYKWYKVCYKSMKKRFPKTMEQIEQSDLAKGIKPYKNRFDYAFRIAKMRWSHCDYCGRKCRKFGGNCDICH